MARTAHARESAAVEQRAGNGEAAARLMRRAHEDIASSMLFESECFSDELLAESDDLSALERQYEAGRFSEQDAKYQLQRSHNAKRGRKLYDAKLRREAPPE